MLPFRSFITAVKLNTVKGGFKHSIGRLAKCYGVLGHIDKFNRHVYRFCNGECEDGFSICIFQSRPFSYTVGRSRFCRKDYNFTFLHLTAGKRSAVKACLQCAVLRGIKGDIE